MKNFAWLERNREYTRIDGETGFTLNVAGMKFEASALEQLAVKFSDAHQEMSKIEAGEIKNPDEQRRVTHFTDRIAYPESELFAEVEAFAEAVRTGEITGGNGHKIEAAVINGIGGSALGPQLVQFAIKGPYWNELEVEDRYGYLKIYFLDNTDSAGLADLLAVADLERTLVVNISKSGGTQEMKNNMIALEKAFIAAGLDYSRNACAITMPGSKLDDYATNAGWLKILPMAESIGGRTSVTAIVGHLPAALAGIDFKTMLAGACYMDEMTRHPDVGQNPSYLLAAMWYIAGGGKGNSNMVIVPYSDRLVLLSRYLQQLVMESLGKELDRAGNTVHQGLNVFGNKGGTDAHAFIQQLNDGRNDFFVTFIEVWEDILDIPIEQGITMGDYLNGFQAGLAEALLNNDRQVIEMRIRKVDEYNLGMLIALYERAVAFYAELININAFHQPGVQAYKLASNSIIALNLQLRKELENLTGFTGTTLELLQKIEMNDNALAVEKLLAKFAENITKREFKGFSISRNWDNDKGWIYQVD